MKLLLFIPLALVMVSCQTSPQEYTILEKREHPAHFTSMYGSDSRIMEPRYQPKAYWVDALNEEDEVVTKALYADDFRLAAVNQPITLEY